MKRRLACLFFVAAVLFVSFPPGSVGHSQEDAPADRKAEIQRLLTARRDTLRQLLEQVSSAYRAGHANLDQMVHVQDRLLKAELELAQSAQERLALHDKRVAAARAFEAAVEQRYKVGLTTHSDVLEAQVARLNAEIGRIRAGLGTAGVPE